MKFGTGAPDRLCAEFFRNLPQGAVILRLDDADVLRFVDANVAAERHLGRELKALRGQLVHEALPFIRPERLAIYANVARTGQPYYLGKVEGENWVLDVKAIPLPERHVAVVFENVTEHMRAAYELKKVNTFLDSVIENIPHMVFWKEAKELRFERFNRAGQELIGASADEFIGKNDYDFFPKEQADFFTSKDREVLERKVLVDVPEEVIQTRHRGQRWLHTKKIPLLDEQGIPRYLLGISEDITERRESIRRAQEELEARVRERTAALVETTAKLERQLVERQRAEEALRRTEEQLRHAQKMEAIGRLAGGIAHDFNNLLSVVLGLSTLLIGRLSPEDPMRADLEEIKTAGERAASLTRQLLAFSRQQVLEPRIVDLNEVITNMDRMLRRLLGEDIELVTRPDPFLGRVKVDPHQMEQVLMNLALNARDAMPNGGRLTIETANVDLDEEYAREHVELTAGPYVVVSVTDTGSGMSRDTLGHIFEPFFTTKERGKGTGLGLSTAFGIVKQSGGAMWVDSEPGKGTSFKVYIPRVFEGVAPTPSPPTSPATLRGTETILLVEDEDPVRHVARTILARNGYEVLEARNGEDAVAHCVTHPGPVHLLLTDVVMPNISGKELAEVLVKRRPEMRVLYMSGYTDKALEHHNVLGDGLSFIQKPLTPDTLARKVREVLDA